jgi:hypothetical protein
MFGEATSEDIELEVERCGCDDLGYHSHALDEPVGV